MICENKHCKKEIEKPLELYDGRHACEHCKALIDVEKRELRYTADNQELYELSESEYFTYLQAKSTKEEVSESKLNKAIELCKEAARQGNPLAVTRVGYYYDKGYMSDGQDEKMRYQLARTYYEWIIYASDVKCDDGMTQPIEFSQLRKRAGMLLIQMLAVAPMEYIMTAGVNFNAVKQDIIMKTGVDAAGVKRNSETRNVAHVDVIYDSILSAVSQVRASLFGIMRITGEELKLVYEKIKAGEGEKLFRSVSVSVARCNENNKVDDGTTFYEFGNTKYNLGTVLPASGDGPLWLFFFSNAGKHRFYGKANKRGKIESALKAGSGKGYDLVRYLINEHQRDCTFFDDDIYLHSNALEPLGKTTRQLIQEVCKNVSGGNR